MEHQSILKNKLNQHEFDYQEGAWEKMNTLLDAAAPTTAVSSRFSFSKWFKLLGAASLAGILFYIASTPSTNPVPEWSGSFTAQPARSNEITTQSKTVITKSEKSENKKENTPKSINSPITAPQMTVSPFVETKDLHKKQHAEPVDDSKVYRENKNHKNPNHITDEHSKVPAATDY